MLQKGELSPPYANIIIVKQTTPMFNEKLQPIYDGRVLANKSAMNDPVVQAVLKEMALRDFQPLPQPLAGTWYISDRH